MSEIKIEKSNILKNAQVLTNGMKLAAALTIITCNILYLIFNKKLMDMEEQKSLILAVGFCVTLFLPIDASLIAQNIFR